MSKQKMPKANYKVFDKLIGKYISRARSKSTWTSEGWAISAAYDHAHERAGGSNWRRVSGTDVDKYMLENIEIHKFPVESAIVIPYSDIVQRVKAEAEEKAVKEAVLKEKREAATAIEEIKRAEAKIEEYKKYIEKQKQKLK